MTYLANLFVAEYKRWPEAQSASLGPSQVQLAVLDRKSVYDRAKVDHSAWRVGRGRLYVHGAYENTQSHERATDYIQQLLTFQVNGCLGHVVFDYALTSNRNSGNAAHRNCGHGGPTFCSILMGNLFSI